MGDDSPVKKSGCGLFNAVFGKRWPRRTTSTGSLPEASSFPPVVFDNEGSGNNFQKTTGTPNSLRRRNSADAFADNGMNFQEAAHETQQHRKSVTKSPTNNPKPLPVSQQQQQKQKQQQQSNGRRNDHQQAAAATMNNNNNKMNPSQGYVNQGKRVPKDAIGISGELEMMIADHQKSRGSSGLVRASSGNVMLHSNLGNLRQPGAGAGAGAGAGNLSPYDHMNNHLQNNNNKYPNSVMGNVVKKQNDQQQQQQHKPAAVSAEPSSLCRALSTRMDPETLKIMGNEDYKSGNFAEALALYDAAISIDPNKASYRSNKSAALTALGRLLEAVFECREAIRIDPQYHRAHHRLANLYLRLGEVEKAIYHYKHAGPEADQVDIAKAKSVQAHLNKCTDAKRARDWNTLIKETRAAITAGADSAPQICALQAEALLKLHKHQDADEVLKNGPNFEVEDCTKFLGPIGNANLLVVRAQVDLAAGRFEDALVAIQKAAKLDSNNKDVSTVTRKAKAVAAARSNGNELFKQAKFAEASLAYGEGLEVDPYNSILLCNRAACRSKLSQYERAIEDCTAALNLRPNYSKARLRRADCLAKIEKWEASIQDYEILKRLTPDDEEVNQALQEVQEQLKKTGGGA